jgi:hypothetical protein
MGEYILCDKINKNYFTGYLINDKRYKDPPFKWSYNIKDAQIFQNIDELYFLIIENKFTDIQIIEDPFNRKIIHNIKFDDINKIFDEDISKRNILEGTEQDNIIIDDIIKNNILQSIENLISKFIKNGIEQEFIKKELFNYFLEKGLTVEIPIEIFGSGVEPKIKGKEEEYNFFSAHGLKTVEISMDEFGSIIESRKNRDVIIRGEYLFMFEIRKIEKGVNIQLKKLGVSDNFRYMGYFNKLIWKGKEYNKYSIYLKFKIIN